MANRYNQKPVVAAETRFTANPLSELEFSKMTDVVTVDTCFNGGELVPILCEEVLPHSTYEIDLNYVIRQTTSKVPVMGELICDVFAFEVPHRVVNESWKNVMGENSSGRWIAPEVELAPLVRSYTQGTATKFIQVPVGSVADHYDFPTQQPISKETLEQCNDLVFKGYLACWNENFRDQNYQNPIAFSKNNFYQGFFELPENVGSNLTVTVDSDDVADGSFPNGALVKALQGEGGQLPATAEPQTFYLKASSFSALGAPLKVNKLHDYFTSALPSPSKGRDVLFNFAETAPVSINTSADTFTNFDGNLQLKLGSAPSYATSYSLGVATGSASTPDYNISTVRGQGANVDYSVGKPITGSNLVGVADLSSVSGLSLSELRTGAAIQKIYEAMGRGGTRYREFIDTFFGLSIDNPFDDVPTCIGQIRRPLDLYQTAQTSASTSDSPQGSLAAFGYTNKGGRLTLHSFKEHGFLHVFVVVRHKNLYSTYMPKHHFRRSMLDFYYPQLANLSEQPIYTRTINPFVYGNIQDSVWGYQEAWAEYRYSPDRCHSLMRSGVDGSLNVWNYADNFEADLETMDGDWLLSNTAEVVARSTATAESTQPQFKGQFVFKITKELPMPVYSVPGMDII